MDDERIVGLYWERDEAAISESEKKYGAYCFSIAKNLLGSGADAEECVSDTWLGAWNAMPPHRPRYLPSFLGKITRRLSLKKLRERNAQKRGGGSAAIPLSELEECLPSGSAIDEGLEAEALAQIINAFLDGLPVDERRIFIRRYWYLDSVGDIASRFGFTQSKVKMTLKRTRDRLRACLRSEDIWV